MPDTTTNPVNINKHNPWLNETNEELAARYNALTTAGMSHPHGLIAEILARPNVFPGFKRGQRTVKVAWTKQDIIEPGTTILTPRGTRVYAKNYATIKSQKLKHHLNCNLKIAKSKNRYHQSQMAQTSHNLMHIG